MDYNIDLDSLDSKQTEFNGLKSTVTEINNDVTTGYIKSLGNSEISSLTNKIVEGSNRLNNGYNNSSTWFNNYLTGIKDVENDLTNFSVDGVEKPIEFKGEFIDIFSKTTIPTLKTGYKGFESGELGNTQASSFYALGDAAYNEWQDFTDDCARAEWIRKVGEIVKKMANM